MPENEQADFFEEIGRQLYNTVFVMRQLGWLYGAQGIAYYGGDTFVGLWTKAFVQDDEKAKKKLIENFYGGYQHIDSLHQEMLDNLYS